jgi:class 3 adenylate cyclase
MTSAPVLDPRLEAAIAELAATGWAVEVADASWCLCWISDDMRELLGAVSDEQAGVGRSFAASRRDRGGAGVVDQETQRSWLHRHLPYMLHDLGGHAALREEIDPEWAALADSLSPVEPPLSWSDEVAWTPSDGRPMKVRYLAQRLYAPNGDLLGTSFTYGASLRARLLAYVARGSEPMFERMVRLRTPARREAAILFADLQASGSLSRRLPSSAYFSLLRELNAAIDDVVIEGNGIVGKHAGDGVTAFFLADDAGSTSTAAAAALQAALRMRAATEDVARCAADLSAGTVNPESIRLNIGVHWGGALYMGQVVTSGRLEVTALGDEVNECARIQECARDGALFASKALIERLSTDDAATLEIDPNRTLYQPLAEISGASDKALRDAGGLAICAIRGRTR